MPKPRESVAFRPDDELRESRLAALPRMQSLAQHWNERAATALHPLARQWFTEAASVAAEDVAWLKRRTR